MFKMENSIIAQGRSKELPKCNFEKDQYRLTVKFKIPGQSVVFESNQSLGIKKANQLRFALELFSFHSMKL